MLHCRLMTCILLAGCEGQVRKAGVMLAVQPPLPFAHTRHPGDRTCVKHQLPTCPVCKSEEYVRRRVCNVVCSALKRLRMKKSMTILEYLGADSWQQVLTYLERKREHWNQQYPEHRMTLTNTALDHIKPVSSFKHCGVSAQKLLCNHYTNLQPLLLQDNTWKGESWSPADEQHWHAHIILQPSYKHVYYPQHAHAQPSLLERHP